MAPTVPDSPLEDTHRRLNFLDLVQVDQRLWKLTDYAIEADTSTRATWIASVRGLSRVAARYAGPSAEMALHPLLRTSAAYDAVMRHLLALLDMRAGEAA